MNGYRSRDGLPPGDLLRIGREVKGYGGEIISALATELVMDGRRGFWVGLDDGH
jgi:hypothetical protein